MSKCGKCGRNVSYRFEHVCDSEYLIDEQLERAEKFYYQIISDGE